eukprot:s386_g5.t1
MTDEIADVQSQDRAVLMLPALQFDPDRMGNLFRNICLFTVYHFQKWCWNTCGVYAFLDSTSRKHLAYSSYAAWSEHLERITDDAMPLSPHSDNGNVLVRLA